MMRIAAVALATMLSVTGVAEAHPAPFSYLDLHVEPLVVRVTAVVHVFDVAHELGPQPPERFLEVDTIAAHTRSLERLLNDRLQIESGGALLPLAAWSRPEPLPDRQSLRLHGAFTSDRPIGSLRVDARLFPYDPQHQTFVNVYERGRLLSQAILGGGTTAVEHFTGTAQGTFAVVRRFLPAGIHHILIGPDHLLFLIGLLLLGGTLRRLAMVVTAFTVAHSVTLSLAVLNIVNPPARIVEPAIALSIIYVGADNLTVRGGRDVRAWIALAFGLIHGFGFAGVLREMNLPTAALGWSLLSFNLGVEIGQLFVVVVVATALAALRAWSEMAGRRLAAAGSAFVIAAGVFWFVQRVFF
jgi:hydrogenase/urease accessory protein HupE